MLAAPPLDTIDGIRHERPRSRSRSTQLPLVMHQVVALGMMMSGPPIARIERSPVSVLFSGSRGAKAHGDECN